MRIKVLFFAVLKDKAGRSEMNLELAEGSDITKAQEQIIRDIPSLKDSLHRAAFAVNQVYVKSNERLNNGDELALIPPVSGGAR